MQGRSKISAIILICLGGLVGFVGLLFKIMHWPGGKVMMAASLPAVTAGFALLIARLKKDQ